MYRVVVSDESPEGLLQPWGMSQLTVVLGCLGFVIVACRMPFFQDFPVSGDGDWVQVPKFLDFLV
jgi:hypothetical protein